MTDLQIYRNPVLTGFHPDPSICRVGDTFYMVTSTFEYYPGIPVYESRDLVHWACIGHCLTRREQLDLESCPPSGGLYAPTIRYWKGTFYVVSTCVSGKGNFVVSAKDPKGPWSAPVWLQTGGIDPSLYFEGERVYFTSNEDSKGSPGIYLCQIDLNTGKRLSDEVLISKGCIGRFPEAPHIYRIRGEYYLLMAEGGTEYGHMVTIQRSGSIWGPYVPCPENPILTHRNMEDMRITCTGHGDLTDDRNGNWWMVLLGVRTLSDETGIRMLHNLGRGTFLAPVFWENSWPRVGNSGRLALKMAGPLPRGNGPGADKTEPSGKERGWHGLDTAFDLEHFSREYLFLRNPVKENYRFLSGEGILCLRGTGQLLSQRLSRPTMLAVRQKEFRVRACVCLSPPYEDGLCCGLTAFYNWEHHYEICVVREDGRLFVRLRRQIYDLQTVTGQAQVPEGDVRLELEADRRQYSFFYQGEDGARRLLGSGAAAALCSEVTRDMSFTGTLLGVFCETGQIRVRSFRAEAFDEIDEGQKEE